MWYKCKVMWQSNQVHLLKLLQKITLMNNSEFCEDVSKAHNANGVTSIIYLWLKCLIFRSIWVKLFKILERNGQEIKISTRMKKFHFCVKYTVLSKTKMKFEKYWYFVTHGLMTLFNKYSNFQNDLINIRSDMTA